MKWLQSLRPPPKPTRRQEDSLDILRQAQLDYAVSRAVIERCRTKNEGALGQALEDLTTFIAKGDRHAAPH